MDKTSTDEASISKGSEKPFSEQIINAMLPLIEKSGHFETSLLDELRKSLQNIPTAEALFNLLKK